jgi:hypothetical protein
MGVVGVMLFAAGIFGVSDKDGQRSLGAVALILGAILVACGIFSFLRERKYFDPRIEYWIEIGLDDLALVTPDAVERHKWISLVPFEVKTTDHKNKYGRTVYATHDTITRCDGVEVRIPLKDFATRLGPGGQDRAERMCAILNELRQDALNRQSGSAGEPYQVPQGLVVAPMPPAKRKPLVVGSSVVQRQ